MGTITSSREAYVITEDGLYRAGVEYVRRESDGMDLYRWRIGWAPNGATDGLWESVEGSDLRSGVQGERNPVRMLQTLGSFLGAYAESYPDGENADLFPGLPEDAASTLSDTIAVEFPEQD